MTNRETLEEPKLLSVHCLTARFIVSRWRIPNTEVQAIITGCMRTNPLQLNIAVHLIMNFNFNRMTLLSE